jgi:hypothetical protein
MNETVTLSSFDVEEKWFLTRSDTCDRHVPTNLATFPSRRRPQRVELEVAQIREELGVGLVELANRLGRKKFADLRRGERPFEFREKLEACARVAPEDNERAA